jgi:di/tricarboxylate transporter
MSIIKGGHPIIFLMIVALLTTLFSLIMSNVASTVVLVPMVINMAQLAGLDPRPVVLMVAVCAANSFILPTHQVNALYMTPGGYRNVDYLKAGGGMTLLFIVVVVSIFYLFYL